MQRLTHFLKLFSILILITLSACGGSSGSGDSAGDTGDGDDGSGDVGDTTDNTVNTTKLVGTPFEGLENGDDFLETDFLCGDYRTETIDELPIKIFAAFFTASEEEEIQAGIDIANTAMGPPDEADPDSVFYELTDEWSNGVRVMYQLTQSGRSYSGITYPFAWNFSGTEYSEKEVTDWAIGIIEVDRYLVAHELGHAAGVPHALINYEDDSLGDLEPYSIMLPSSGTELTDYTIMMEHQAQIILDHLGEKSTSSSGFTSCD